MVSVTVARELTPVAGSGVYAVGKVVTVKATAAKGNVFAGWYDADDVPLSGSADFRTVSFPYVMGGGKTVLTAVFATEGEDKSSLKLVNVTFAGYSALLPLSWNAEAKAFVLVPEE